MTLIQPLRKGTLVHKDGIERIEIWLKGQLVDTIPGNKQRTMTTTYEVERNGTYYLWITTEATTGKKYKSVSREFNFDNEGPRVESIIYNPLTASTYSLECNANDIGSGIAKYEFLVNEKVEKTVETQNNLTSG